VITERVTPNDAAWMAPLWNESAKGYKKWWPVAVPTEFRAQDVAAAIDVSTQTHKHGIYVDPQRRGFFICRPGILPEHPPIRPHDPPGAIASELVIWIVKRDLPPDEYRAVLHGLFVDWLGDEMKRKEFTYAFGQMPCSMPAGDRKYLDDWAKNKGCEVVEYVGLGKVRWRRYYGSLSTPDWEAKLP